MILSKVKLPKGKDEREDLDWIVKSKKQIFIGVVIAAIALLFGVLTGGYTYYILGFYVALICLGTQRTMEWACVVHSIFWKLLVITTLGILLVWNFKYFDEIQETKLILQEHMDEVVEEDFGLISTGIINLTTSGWYWSNIYSQLMDIVQYTEDSYIVYLAEQGSRLLSDEELLVLENNKEIYQLYDSVPIRFSGAFKEMKRMLDKALSEGDINLSTQDEMNNSYLVSIIQQSTDSILLLFFCEVILFFELFSLLMTAVLAIVKYFRGTKSVEVV